MSESASPVPVPLPGASLWRQLHRALRWFRVLLSAVAVLLVVLLAMEIARLWDLAHRAHPLLGLLVLAAAASGGLLIIVPAVRFLRVPKVVTPPPVPDAHRVTRRDLRRQVRYLERYLSSGSRNPELARCLPQIEEARGELSAFAARARTTPDGDLGSLLEELQGWKDTAVGQVLVHLDRKAERVIYEEALSVGVGTAVSPNGLLDAFVMLWRSVNLVSRLAVLYYGRPGLLGTLSICRDVSVATALAGYLQNVTDSVGGFLARSVGGVTGVVAGPALEGITNALVVVRIGYLAKERCRSFQAWDQRTRRSALTVALSASQRVAVGLSAEIIRRVSTSIGAVAGAAATGARQVAADLGQRISSILRGKKSAPEDDDAGDA